MSKSISSLIAAILIMISLAVFTDARAQRKSVSATEVNGTFRMNFKGKFKDNSNEIKILALGGGKIRFAMDLVYPYTLRNGELMVNMGGLDDQASITRDTAIYISEDGKCKIRFTFVRAGTLKVEQKGTDGECGFGHNVFATGTYRKVSSRSPKFDTGL